MADERSDRLIRAVADVASAQLKGGAVLLDLRTGRHFTLNEVGAELWRVLQEGPSTRASLVDALLARFDAPRPRIAVDVDALLEGFESGNLVCQSS